jgi:hypothetical protein
MSVLIKSSRSVVAHHVCGRTHRIDLGSTARPSGLRAERPQSAGPTLSAGEGGVAYKAVTTATTDSYTAAAIPAIAAD